MATPHRDHRHHDHYVHDSEDTSDSNDEFASASEGDDDLPWEPVVIRSPIISRQSPVSPAPFSSQVQVETPRPAHAITTSINPTTTGTTTITRSTSSSSSIATTTTTTTTSRALTATSSSFGQQHLQQHEQQPQVQHDFDQGRQEHYRYEQQSYDASPHHHSHHGQEQQWEQHQHHQHQQQQRSSTSIPLDSSSPKSHHAHREFSSSSSSSTRSQGSPSQILRGAAPKLRERMRQSPVLHSRIVQAYLDPSASQAQHQQQQHVSSENVRQAWLQDAHQESSEDDTEEEREQEHRHTSSTHPIPTRAPIPVYHHPVVPLPIEVAPVPSFEALSPVDQHDTEQSWNNDEYEDQVPSDHHHHQEEIAWGFNDQTDIEGGAQPGEQQVEEAWGFDEPIDIQGGAKPQTAEPPAEAAWGFDDNIQAEENVQDQSYRGPTQDPSNVHIREAVRPPIHQDETRWGFDDNLHVDETVQPDLHQVEAAWGFDDNIDIEGGTQAEDLPEAPIAIVENITQLVETAHPDQHEGESAWGFDDNIHIDETAQPEQRQGENAWGFDDTIDVVTTAATQGHQHQETTADTEVKVGVDLSSTILGDAVRASWGFEDKIEIGDTPQVEQIESSWGFDEPIAVEDQIGDHEVERPDNSVAAVEPTYPAMHQAHESDADAWDYDDQAIELIEEAAVQEIRSASFTADQHDNTFDQRDFQQSHTSTTDDSFSEHVVMPPVSATLSTDNYENDQELAVIVDHTTTDEPNQLAQEQPSHTDTTVFEFDTQRNLHRAVPEEIHSVDSARPSDAVEAAEAEQSWGFDMDGVIEGEELESAALDNPSLDEIAQESYQHEKPHVVSSTVDNTHDQIEQQSFAASTVEASEDMTEDIEAAAIVDETKHADQASDDEHDSEVREVLFATQHNPVAVLEEGECSEISPFATNSRVHSGGSVSFDHKKPYYADAAVTSHLLVKEDAAPSLRSDSRGSIGELKRSASDSEGSDIYGDLSTAYTGRNMSSNRLNEILDDDDYLEHMERGVPMDRSISTPFSDDESPKFVMEDDVVELMERGEPQPVGGAPADHLETLDDEEDVNADDNQATSSSERVIDTSNVATPSDLALPLADNTVPQSLPDAVEETMTDSLSHAVETSAVEEQAVKAPSVEDVKVADLEEQGEAASAAETVDDSVSDDRDPANPFSDAAAIDGTDLWSVTEPLLEKTEKEELPSESVAEASSQDSTVNIEGLSHAIDERLEDTWTDQGLNVVVEPTLDISTPPATQATPETHMDAKPEAEETQPLVENVDQDIIDGLDGDAWGDQDVDIVDNTFTRVLVSGESKETPAHRQEVPVVEHQKTQSHALAEPEQPLVEPSVDLHDVEAAAEPGPFDNLKEEVANDDLPELATVKDAIVEAHVPSPLLDVETSAVHGVETPASQHVDIMASTPKESTLEVDAWSNQTDSLDLYAALEVDAWADQDDAVPAEIPVVPAAPAAVVNEERSVSDLFADKSDQHYGQLSSPVRAFAFSPARADSPVRESATSPVRGFAAYARSPTSPKERSVSDLFGDKPEKLYLKSASPARGFAAYAAYSHVTHQQERSVSDFSETPAQQPVKPSTRMPATAPVKDDLLKDAVEEDAWDDQDIEITDEPLPVATKVEPEREPESVATAFDVERSIDDALGGDAWGDDQNVQIDQERESAKAEPHIDTPAADVDVQEIHNHVAPTVEQTTEFHSTQVTTHTFGIDQIIVNAIEDNAWDNQEGDMSFESTLPPQQELEQELQNEPVAVVPETAPLNELVQGNVHKHQEPTADALSIDHSLEASLEEDAWDNQDGATSGQEFEALHEHQPTGHSHVSVHSEDVVAKDNHPFSALGMDLDHAIEAAMEEDMWTDNDVSTFNETPVQAQIHTLIPASTIAETPSAEESPVSNQLEEHENQQILPSFGSLVLPTSTDAEVEFDLDKALENDAWNDQDIDVGLHSAEPAPNTTNTHVGTVPESLDLDAEKSEERPSRTGSRIGSIMHQTHTKTAAEIVEDAWGWDEDEIAVNPETRNDNDANTFAQDDQDEAEHESSRSPVEAEEVAVVQEKTTPDAHSPTQVPAETPDNNLPPLAIQKEHLAAGADSGEGEADSATQSPWQDISPASVSKRSEAGMSIGSEFESEYSVRSLDEDGHVSSAFDRHQPHGHDTSVPSTDSETRKALETTMSWTNLKDDDAWDEDLPEIGPVNPLATSKEPSAPTKEVDNSADAQQLPDISGVDNWDFDQDDDIQSESSSSFAGLTPASTRASFSSSLKTPDMTVSRSFGSQPSPQNKTPTFSSITSSPGQVLSSYQSSMVGSTPASPSQATDSAVTPSAAEVEDDSHLPVAIRQQRARLAARGKPLPPISKYKSTKEVAVEQQSSPVLSAASPRLAAAAATSPVISFASLAKTPVSPMLNPMGAAVPDQKYLSPALQKQRERLEKKRAASTTATTAPLSTARRLVPSSSLISSSSFSSQVPIKPTSPLLKEAVLPAVLKHTLPSPTSVRKSVHLVDRSETTTSPSTFSIEEFGHSTRRRGLSVSSNQSAQATTPLTPAGDGGVVRRSKEGNRPSMFSSFSASITPTSATFFEMGESNIAKSTQNDAFRHVSRLSVSSSTAGSGWDDTVEEDVKEAEEAEKSKGWGDKKGSKTESKLSSKGVDRKEAVSRPTMFSSTSSSSFYQQSVPGLDDDDFGESSDVKSTAGGGSSSFISNTNITTTNTSTTSSYLNNKKADDYDPYGPKASHKAKSSIDVQDRDLYPEATEVLIGRSTPSPGVSLLSPTSATSMSHRYDHHQQQHASSNSKFGGGSVKEVTHTSNTNTNSSSSGGGGFGGGFFGGGGGGGSLVGDINSLLQEKKNPAPTSSTGFGSSSGGANLGSDYEPKKSSTSAISSGQPPSAVQQKQQAPSKSSSWSFGSWVSSAVAAATDKIDQAYETLDPEYSRMKARPPMMSNSTSFASNVGAEGSGDPDSLSPFKKPGYVVGGSSLALGLASISTPGTSGASAAPGTGSAPQTQAHRHAHSSSETPLSTMSSNNNNKRDEDSYVEESFASAGTESSDSYGHHAGHAHHRVSHNTERDQSLSPRLTRKNVR
ncbi:hypothetical protein BGZ47_009602 [Haplosporangium gracile]|nr:hypothetical protein BGZ47_009602 [Haplosporangium gracile]